MWRKAFLKQTSPLVFIPLCTVAGIAIKTSARDMFTNLKEHLGI